MQTSRGWSVTDTSIRQRLAAILAADVAGYTCLMAGDERGTLATDTMRMHNPPHPEK